MVITTYHLAQSVLIKVVVIEKPVNADVFLVMKVSHASDRFVLITVMDAGPVGLKDILLIGLDEYMISPGMR